MDFWNGLNARLRTAITLAFLVVLMLGGVTWGFAQVVSPFPGKAEPALCVPTTYAAGESLVPADVTVSVLNASDREGLAGRTMQLFTDAGFAEGQTSNAPEGTAVDVAEIWTDQKNDPAAKLVRSWMGKSILVNPDGTSPAVGITVVVGDQFAELVAGVPSVVLRAESTICSPPVG